MIESTFEKCRLKAEHGCWKPLAELLLRQPQPVAKPQLEEYFFGHLALAHYAYWFGDFEESKKFFERVLEIAKSLDQVEVEHPGFVTAFAAGKAAEPALSSGDYKKALAYLDVALAYPVSSEFKESLSLMRAGALAGLHRDAEARLALDLIVASLHWDGQAPWEGFPFAPEPVNPYEIARRVAAYYVHQGDAAAALALLERAEGARRATIENMPKEFVPGGFWAQKLPAGILQWDMASVHEQQGDEAMAVQLRMAAPMGKASDASKPADRPMPDPLAKVLGLLN